MVVNCSQCGKETSKKPSQIKRNKNHFCCKECHNEWMKTHPTTKPNKIKIKCKYCNKDFLVPKYKINNLNNGIQKHIFCSISCKNKWFGENNRGNKNVKYNKLEKICLECGEKYLINKSEYENSKFCCRKCKDNYNHKNNIVFKRCIICNKEFSVVKSKETTQCCCKKCANKVSAEKRIKNRVDKICVICGKEYWTYKNKAKTSITCCKKCHDTWLKEVYSKTPEAIKQYKITGIISTLNQKTKNTKPELITKEYLTKNNIYFISQCPMYNQFIVDFYIPDRNLVLEVFGDYWHGNPNKYGNNKKPLTERQIKQKEKDKYKENYLKNKGFNFVYIWEDDIYNNLDIIMKDIFI